jgi:hypothetical protein
MAKKSLTFKKKFFIIDLIVSCKEFVVWIKKGHKKAW